MLTLVVNLEQRILRLADVGLRQRRRRVLCQLIDNVSE